MSERESDNIILFNSYNLLVLTKFRKLILPCHEKIEKIAHLVSLDGSNFLVGLNRVTRLFMPCLQCTLRYRLGHLRDFDGLGYM